METACSISKVDREVGRRGSTSRTALHPWQAKNGRLRAWARTTFELSQSEARVWLAGRSTDRDRPPREERQRTLRASSALRRECLSCRGRKSRHREQRGQQQFAAAVPTSRTQEPRVLHGSVGAGASHPTSWKVVATPACLRPGVAWRVMAHDDNLFFGPGSTRLWSFLLCAAPAATTPCLSSACLTRSRTPTAPHRPATRPSRWPAGPSRLDGRPRGPAGPAGPAQPSKTRRWRYVGDTVSRPCPCAGLGLDASGGTATATRIPRRGNVTPRQRGRQKWLPAARHRKDCDPISTAFGRGYLRSESSSFGSPPILRPFPSSF